MSKQIEVNENLNCLKQILMSKHNGGMSREDYSNISNRIGTGNYYGITESILQGNLNVSHYKKLQKYCYERLLGIKVEYCIPDIQWYQKRLIKKTDNELKSISAKTGISMCELKLISKCNYDMEMKHACTLYDALKYTEVDESDVPSGVPSDVQPDEKYTNNIKKQSLLSKIINFIFY